MATASQTTTPTFTASIEDGSKMMPGGLVVRSRVHGIEADRTEMVGYVTTNRKVAERLVRAIEAGAVFDGLAVRTDVNGKTYVSARSHVLGRMLSADLRRLGY